jgi:uncharacterized protein (DUF2252 family)
MIFRQAERSTPQKILAKLTQPEPVSASHSAVLAPAAKAALNGKGPLTEHRFRSMPPLLRPLPTAEAKQVLTSLNDYVLTLEPERRHFLSQYSPIDVAFKVVGTGSVGTRDFVIYFEAPSRPGHTDPLFLQIKEEPASAYARYLPAAAEAITQQGKRVVDGARAMQLISDPFLGYTTLNGRDYLVRQLNDHKAGLDMTTIDAASLEGYADLCGEVFARGHARAGDPVAISAYLGASDRFDRAILRFAAAYADKTERDWGLLRKWLKSKGGPEGAARKRTTASA